jgi:hypothetical protein
LPGDLVTLCRTERSIWGKVAIVPLLRRTSVLLEDGPGWPSAVVPTVNGRSLERGARCSQPCHSTEARRYPLTVAQNAEGGFGTGGYDDASDRIFWIRG